MCSVGLLLDVGAKLGLIC